MIVSHDKRVSLSGCMKTILLLKNSYKLPDKLFLNIFPPTMFNNFPLYEQKLEKFRHLLKTPKTLKNEVPVVFDSEM